MAKTDPVAALALQAVRVVGADVVSDDSDVSDLDTPHAVTLVATMLARTRCRILITVRQPTQPPSHNTFLPCVYAASNRVIACLTRL